VFISLYLFHHPGKSWNPVSFIEFPDSGFRQEETPFCGRQIVAAPCAS
jgi:hypothetical protein